MKNSGTKADAKKRNNKVKESVAAERADTKEKKPWIKTGLTWGGFSPAEMIALALLVLFPPLVRGLYFPPEMYIYMTMAGAACAVTLLLKRKQGMRSFGHPMDWCLVVLVLLYVLTILWSASPGDAVFGALKMLTVLLVYWTVVQLVRSVEQLRTMLWVLGAGAAAVAAIGLLAAAGVLPYPGAYSNGAIASTFQYVNTTAAYLGAFALLMIGTALWESGWRRYLALALAWVMMVVSFAAVSKGGLLATSFGLILLLVGLTGRHRLKALGAAAVVMALAYVGAVFLVPAVAVQGASLEAVKVAQAPTTVADAGEQVAPETNKTHIMKEWEELGQMENMSYVTRLDFMRWALAIVKDHPLGTGAGGWEALYHRYQDYQFFTTQVHNHFLQVAVETGIPGFIAFVGIWVFVLVEGWRRRKEQETGAMAWFAATTALTLAFHAGYDFDFSLTGVLLAALTLGAGVRTQTEEAEGKCRINGDWNNRVVAALMAIILLAGSAGVVGSAEYQQAFKAANAGDVEEAYRVLKATCQAIPYQGIAHAQLGQMAAVKFEQGQKESWEVAQRNLRAASQWEPSDINVMNTLTKAYSILGDGDRQIEAVERLNRVNPWDWGAYYNLNRYYYAAAMNCLQEGDEREARTRLKQCVKITEDMLLQAKRVNRQRLQYWQSSRLELNPEMKTNAGRANLLLGRFEPASVLLLQAMQEKPEDEELKGWYLAAIIASGQQRDKVPFVVTEESLDLASEIMLAQKRLSQVR